MDNSLCCWSVWGVKDLPHQQRLQSPPDHPGNGTRLHVLHQVVAIGGWKMTADILSLFARLKWRLCAAALDTYWKSCRK